MHIPTPHTIADGAQTQHSGRLSFPVIQALVRGIVTVTDDQLVSAMRFFAERMKLVVEPTGALGAAALLERAEGLPDLRGRRLGVIVSGGNVDLARYAAPSGCNSTPPARWNSSSRRRGATAPRIW